MSSEKSYVYKGYRIEWDSILRRWLVTQYGRLVYQGYKEHGCKQYVTMLINGTNKRNQDHARP